MTLFIQYHVVVGCGTLLSVTVYCVMRTYLIFFQQLSYKTALNIYQQLKQNNTACRVPPAPHTHTLPPCPHIVPNDRVVIVEL